MSLKLNGWKVNILEKWEVFANIVPGFSSKFSNIYFKYVAIDVSYNSIGYFEN